MKLAAALSALVATGALGQTLNVYNWSDYIAEDTIAKFEAETGISVTYDVYDSNETLEAKLLAGNSGYDIVVPTSEFLQRQVPAGVYQPLQKDLLPNLANMDADLMAQAAQYDPDNTHSVIYMWGTTGLGINVPKVTEILGEDAPLDSWALVFDPEIVAQLADCGVSLLDAPTEVMPAAMNYLGLGPDSRNPDDFDAAADLVASVRPHLQYFHSSQYITDLANGDLCVAMGFSGDVFIAQARAEEAETGAEITYVIPNEGALQWFDLLAIPADAPNPEAAHAWIDFIMRPDITADITNYVYYANGNAAAMPMVLDEVKEDPAIFPPAEVLANLWAGQVYTSREDRALTRAWTRAKTGQ